MTSGVSRSNLNYHIIYHFLYMWGNRCTTVCFVCDSCLCSNGTILWPYWFLYARKRRCSAQWRINFKYLFLNKAFICRVDVLFPFYLKFLEYFIEVKNRTCISYEKLRKIAPFSKLCVSTNFNAIMFWSDHVTWNYVILCPYQQFLPIIFSFFSDKFRVVSSLNSAYTGVSSR